MHSDHATANQPHHGQVGLDWLADLVIPAAVFGLLGTLLYFLIDLRQYLAGGEAGLLRYVVFWFLIGVIGLARMSARPGLSTISPEFYCVLLGAAVLLVTFSWTSVEGALTPAQEVTNPSLGLIINLLTVAGIWASAWFLTSVCTRPEHALEEARFGGVAGPGGPTRITAAPLRAVLAVSAFAIAIFGYGLAVVNPASPIHAHAFFLAGLYIFFALLLMALIALAAARLAARTEGLRIRATIPGAWVVGAALVGLLLVLCAGLLPGVASRQSPAPQGRRWADRSSAQDTAGRGVRRGHSTWPEHGRHGARRGAQSGTEPGGVRRRPGEGPFRGGAAARMIARMLQALAEASAKLWWLLWLLVILALLAGVYWQRRRLVRALAAVVAFMRMLAARLARLLRRRRGPSVGLPSDPWADIFSLSPDAAVDPSVAVRHVWRAIQLFYSGLGVTRSDSETEIEFASRLPSRYGIKSASVRKIALAFAACEYGHVVPSGETLREVEAFWRALLQAVAAAREQE